MMRPTLLLTVLVASVAGTSAPHALAYLTPEQVLIQNQYYHYTPTREQRQQAQARNAARAENLHGAAKSSSSAASSVAAPAVEEPPDSEGTVEEGELIQLDAETIRLINRLVDRSDGSTTPVHGSAPSDYTDPYNPNPLAPTGMASAMLTIVVLGAVAWTFCKAWKLEKSHL